MENALGFIEGFNATKEFEMILSFGSKLLYSLITIVICAVLIRLSNVIITKSFKSNSKFSERKRNTLTTVFESVVKYILYFIAVCTILTTFGINIASIIAVAGVGSVAIGFGAQSLVKDVISGIFILLEDQFGVGDFVSIDGLSGKVEAISIRTTGIRSADGNLYIVPNGHINIVTNMSKGFNRAVVDIGIAYEADVDKTIEVLNNEMKGIYEKKKIDGLMATPEVLGVVEFGDSAVTIRISADCHVGENWQIERELRRLIKNRLDKEGICIPYPQCVVHIAKEEEKN